MATLTSTSLLRRPGWISYLTASIGWDMGQHSNASRNQDKHRCQRTATTCDTNERNTCNTMVVASLTACAVLHKCAAHEDWRHILSCTSLYASLHSAESWSSVKLVMKTWKLVPDFWTAIDNGVNHYIKYPLRCDKVDIPAEP
jgi:hypothetical protein